MTSERSMLPEKIEEARKRLDGIVKPTPIMTSTTLDQMIGARVLIKPENLQKTGSFKIRGAFNRLAAMTEAEKKRGVVAASAGNTVRRSHGPHRAAA